MEELLNRIAKLEDQAKASNRMFSSIADRFEETHSWQRKAGVLLERLEAIQDALEELLTIKLRVDNISERVDELEETRW